VSNLRSVPVTFAARGLSDAFSVGEAFPGAMSALQNFIPNPAANFQWVPRPAAQMLVGGTTSNWAGFNWGAATWGSGWGAILGPGMVSGLFVVGNLAFGTIASTSGVYAGKDMPFVYDIKLRQFHDVTISGGVGSLPNTPAATGDWVPPRFASFPGRVVVTHPGFAGTGSKVGWIDYSGFVDNTHTGNTHSGTTTIDSLSSNVILAGWEVGDQVSGPGIPAGTTIVSMASNGLSMVVSNPSTATGTGVTLTISGGTVTTPVWGSGNTNQNLLTAIPTDVFNFNGRAYYAVPGGGMQFSDVGYPLQITNANQALTPSNGLDVTCFGGLPINQTQTGPISTLFAFQGDSNILKVTGDPALSNLALNSVPNGLGTLAPNSIASTPLGLMFVSPDGLRFVDFDGNAQPRVGANGEGVNLPLINAVSPSRINAAYNEDVYQVSVQNGAKSNTPWESYWYHVSKQVFSGPHTDPSVVLSPYQQQAGSGSGHGFLFAPQAVVGALAVGSVIPNANSTYTEFGTPLVCVWQTAYSDDNQMMTENALVESTLLCSVPAQSVLTALVVNELGTTLDQVQITGPLPAPVWQAFNWGAANWGVVANKLYQQDLAWHLPVVFKQMALRVTVTAGPGLVVGAFRYGNIVLGYRLETFKGYV
jgi:hypothetical protein